MFVSAHFKVQVVVSLNRYLSDANRSQSAPLVSPSYSTQCHGREDEDEQNKSQSRNYSSYDANFYS